MHFAARYASPSGPSATSRRAFAYALSSASASARDQGDGDSCGYIYSLTSARDIGCAAGARSTARCRSRRNSDGQRRPCARACVCTHSSRARSAPDRLSPIRRRALDHAACTRFRIATRSSSMRDRTAEPAGTDAGGLRCAARDCPHVLDDALIVRGRPETARCSSSEDESPALDELALRPWRSCALRDAAISSGSDFFLPARQPRGRRRRRSSSTLDAFDAPATRHPALSLISRGCVCFGERFSTENLPRQRVEFKNELFLNCFAS